MLTGRYTGSSTPSSCHSGMGWLRPAGSGFGGSGGWLMEQPVGQRMGALPSCTRKRSQESVLIPTTWSFPASWQDSLSRWENLLPLSRSEAAANSDKALCPPQGLAGLPLLPRELVLARRWQGETGSAPQQLTARPGLCPPLHVWLRVSAPAPGPRPIFLPGCSHAGSPSPCASQLSPFGVRSRAVRDPGNSPFYTLECESCIYLWEFF